MNLAIFLSGTGSNFKAIAEAIEQGKIPAKITLVASNKPDTLGLITAKDMGFYTTVFQRSEYPDGASFANYMLGILSEREVHLIALAGYLRKIPPNVLRAFSNRIVNIHPALLPKFGGKGMYGMNVHRAVIEAGESESGVTIHSVNEEYDCGEIIAQRRVPVLTDDIPETLAARVLKVEHQFYSEVIKEFAIRINKELKLND
ncbi:MAG: phosphoribosylglycinamide formyltransferase [Candidatus Hatepunaea meridiana]|nr:phosphoribosylglycinamide formyltransferase [Candidatus Hatepunaea meridiana]